MSKNQPRKPTILLIAPIQQTGASDTNILGGNKVMADEHARELGLRGFGIEIVDTSGSVTNLPPWRIRANYLMRFLRITKGALKNIRRSDVVFLILASYSAISMASFFWVVCKIARKPLVVRITGGDLSRCYLNYGAAARWLSSHTWMRSSLVYVETQGLHRMFSDWHNFRWFPNTRDIKPPAAIRRSKINNLIFLARLHMDKGLAEALDACRHLPEGCHLNIFGPAMSDTDFSLFDVHPKATYGGVLDPAEVPRVMNEHDLLLFPSYMNEGYPGSILEAFQCGVPVVAAKMGGVPELVEHEESGLLIEPHSAEEIRSALERLLQDAQLYRRLCEGAKRRGEYFRSPNWYDRVAAELRSLCCK